MRIITDNVFYTYYLAYDIDKRKRFIMARFITGGDAEFNALVYGAPAPTTVEYLQNNIQQFGQHLNNSAQYLHQKAVAAFESIASSSAMRLSKAIHRKASTLWEKDVIRPLATIGDLQHAPLCMQRYLMAQPDIRHLYHKQQCDGYSDTYVDAHPGQVGEKHYDYRQVMQGIVTEDKTGNMFTTNYLDTLQEGDVELDISEQSSILISWQSIEKAIALQGDDPSSIYNASL